jgi:hypothetical protein
VAPTVRAAYLFSLLAGGFRHDASRIDATIRGREMMNISDDELATMTPEGIMLLKKRIEKVEKIMATAAENHEENVKKLKKISQILALMLDHKPVINHPVMLVMHLESMGGYAQQIVDILGAKEQAA